MEEAGGGGGDAGQAQVEYSTLLRCGVKSKRVISQ